MTRPDHAKPTPKPRPEPLRSAAAWVFDLDNTLYSAEIDLFAQIDVRMRDFIADFLGVAPADAFRLQKHYFREFGTSLRGLMHVHGMLPGPFLEHVHDIDLSVLPADPELDQALAALPGRKLIYTNASAGHAERVIARLGITRHFEAIFGIAEADYVPKPEPWPYSTLVARHNLDPHATVMVEDTVRNLGPAAALGMTTVWVRTTSDHSRYGETEVAVDHVTDRLTLWLQDVIAGQPGKVVPIP